MALVRVVLSYAEGSIRGNGSMSEMNFNPSDKFFFYAN